MIYFIPAWYEGSEWTEREQIWYLPGKSAEFDDTVKQVQLFSRSGLFPYEILLLSFAPNFRHFLHRQSIFRANYWSVFDQIQCVKRKSPAVLSYHDLAWPEGVEFLYSRFAVLAYIKEKKYAKVDFGDGGNMIRVTLYRNDEVARVNTYDDRGFLSLTAIYQNGRPQYEEYLDEAGVWKAARFFDDGHVEINPKNAFFSGPEGRVSFAKARYENLEAVIREVFLVYLQRAGQDDVFVVAMHDQHTRLLSEILKGRKTVLSFFKKRMQPTQNRMLQQFLDSADYIVADTMEDVRMIEQRMDRHYRHITAITPYDSRLDHEISLEFSTENVMIAVDDIEEEFLKSVLKAAGVYASSNEKIRLHLFTRQNEWDRPQKLRELTDGAFRELKDVTAPLYEVDQCVTPMAVNRKMRESRLLIDLRPVPDQFMQITAMSMGIPQITLIETQYLTNGRNGHAIESLEDLPKWMAFYLEDLSNWNAARIASYEMGASFSTQEIRRQWTEVIQKVESE